MGNEDNNLINLMINKSEESFLLAIELYNKPTISLNIEGFVIFIANAWELLLKAYLLKRNENIHYKKPKSRNRTLALNALIKKVMTNEKDPVRINLEIISSLRNNATHLIIPEYAKEFNGLFLSNVQNYVNKLKQYFNIDINDKFNTDFLSISIPSNKNIESDILGKYGKEVFDRYNKINKSLNKIYQNTQNESGYIPKEISISYEIKFKKVNDSNAANMFFYNSKNEESLKTYKIIESKNIEELYPLTHSMIISEVQSRLNKNSITFTPYTKSKNTNFNKDTFKLFCREFNIKSNLELCYYYSNFNRYSYSYKLIELIVNEIIENPDIFIEIRNKKS